MWTVTLDGKTVASLVLAATGFVALALSTTRAADAADAARRAPRTTHVAQNVDDFVVLRLTDAAGTPKFVRSHADGSQDTAEFSVPEGSKLVVTDVDYSITAGTFGQKAAAVRIRLQNKSSSAVTPVFISSRNLIAGEVTGSGTKYFGDTTGLFTGFAVEPGARIVADYVLLFNVGQAATSAFADARSEVILRGYLTSAD